jgi:hypothetical protein
MKQFIVKLELVNR